MSDYWFTADTHFGQQTLFNKGCLEDIENALAALMDQRKVS